MYELNLKLSLLVITIVLQKIMFKRFHAIEKVKLALGSFHYVVMCGDTI